MQVYLVKINRVLKLILGFMIFFHMKDWKFD